MSELVGSAVWINRLLHGRGRRCGDRSYVSILRLGSSDCASEQRDRASQQLDHPKQVSPHHPRRYSSSQPPLPSGSAVLWGNWLSLLWDGHARDSQILFSMKNMLL